MEIIEKRLETIKSLLKIAAKRAALIEERDKYNHEAEDREIERKERELNQTIQTRNDKKSLFDSKNKEINRLNDLEQAIKELYPNDEVDDESGIELPIEEEH